MSFADLAVEIGKLPGLSLMRTRKGGETIETVRAVHLGKDYDMSIVVTGSADRDGQRRVLMLSAARKFVAEKP